jgi:hypothetical protein
MGMLVYRVLAESSTGQELSTAALPAVTSYGQVSLGDIVGSPPSTTTVGGAPFNYVWSASDWDRQTVWAIEQSSCRSLNLVAGYIAPAGPANVATTATVDIIQLDGTNAVNVPTNSTNTVAATLTDASFEIALENAVGTAYINGSASCWTANGEA